MEQIQLQCYWCNDRLPSLPVKLTISNTLEFCSVSCMKKFIDASEEPDMIVGDEE